MITELKKDLMKAMKEKNIDVKNCLQVVLSTITNESIKVGRELTDAEVVDIIKKEIKQLNETISFATDREDIKTACESKIAYLEQYVPAQMDADEVLKFITENIDSSCTNVGITMKKIMPLLKGKADNKVIADMVKKFFS